MRPANKSCASLLPQSKKISKAKGALPRRTSKQAQITGEYLVMETGYDTFLKEERDEILAILKDQILTLKGLDSSLLASEEEVKRIDWMNVVKELGPKPLNQLLRKIIPQYRPDLDLTTKELINLRKKVKGWLGSEGVSEKRGDPLIQDEEMPRFREALLKCMKLRNFKRLRNDILPVIKQIREESSRRFEESMFSKKFWSTFLNKEENQDIKALWESLPQTKTKNPNAVKKVKTAMSSCSTYGSEDDRTHLIEILYSPAGSQGQKTMWSEEETYFNMFDEREPQYSVEKFLADTEDIFSETSHGNSDCKTMQVEEKDVFLGEFWSAWNQRNVDKSNFFNAEAEPF